MGELNFKLCGPTEGQYRKWRRSGQPKSSALAAIVPLGVAAAALYVLTTTVDTILWAFVERPVAEVRLSGAAIGPTGPDGARLQFSVSPLDPDGRLISLGLDRRNFAFSTVSITPADGGGTVVSGTAVPTDVNVVVSPGGRRLKVLLLFDSSGSMTDNDPQRLRIAAGERFVQSLAPGIEAAVMDFTGLRRDFTTSKPDLRAGIASIGADGGTPLFDKLHEGICSTSCTRASRD